MSDTEVPHGSVEPEGERTGPEEYAREVLARIIWEHQNDDPDLLWENVHVTQYHEQADAILEHFTVAQHYTHNGDGTEKAWRLVLIQRVNADGPTGG